MLDLVIPSKKLQVSIYDFGSRMNWEGAIKAGKSKFSGST